MLCARCQLPRNQGCSARIAQAKMTRQNMATICRIYGRCGRMTSPTEKMHSSAMAYREAAPSIQLHRPARYSPGRPASWCTALPQQPYRHWGSGNPTHLGVIVAQQTGRKQQRQRNKTRTCKPYRPGTGFSLGQLGFSLVVHHDARISCYVAPPPQEQSMY